MPVKELRDQRHNAVLEEIAAARFPYPNDENPQLETLLNLPEPVISAGQWGGQPLYPDIVVVRRPGQWLEMMAEVETADSLTDEQAEARWAPFAQQGALLLYVPAGRVQETRRLCRRHGVRPRGIRTWRYRPVWGLTVHEA